MATLIGPNGFKTQTVRLKPDTTKGFEAGSRARIRRWQTGGSEDPPQSARRRSSESGNAIIELAFALPLLLLVVMGIFDFGFMFQEYEVVTNGAREGARIAILPGYGDAVVQARVQNYLTTGGLLGTATTTVATANVPIVAGGPTITVRTVTVAYPHTFTYIGPIASLFGGAALGTVNLTAVATMRSEVAAAGS